MSSNENIKSENKIKDQKLVIKLKIIGYFALILLFTLFIYLVKPIIFVLQLVFLSDNTGKSPEDKQLPSLFDQTTSPLYLIGWLIIFLAPLWNFFYHGLKIILLQESLIMKLWAGIVLLAECIVGIPLTFLYSNNMFSIFLFGERDIQQLINPWLIFFPTKYILSYYELIRNFFEALFFTVVGGLKYNIIKDNIFETYIIIIIIVMISLNVIKVISYSILFFLKLTSLKKKKVHLSVKKN